MTVLEEIKGLTSFEKVNPVILVPNANLQGNLCLANAVSFFKDGTYKVVSDRANFDSSKESFTYNING